MESLGNKLKITREAKGYSFDYVSREINISTRYLEALEREDFTCFPGEPYVRGFLKNYGEYLGINTDELMSLYRALKIQEQPIPMEQLLKGPSPMPRILGAIGVVLAVLVLAGAAIFIIYRLPKKSPVSVPERRPVSEYVLNSNSLEKRLYPGDSVLVTVGNNAYKLILSGLSDAVTIATPRGNVMLDLGQEAMVDLNNDGFQELRIIASDFVKNDSARGVLMRFEQEAPVPQAAVPESVIPIETYSAGRDTVTIIPAVVNPFPFTLRAVFQGYCLFRYEILAERDKQGRSEQYYQRSEEISVTAQNGIRLGISNAQAVRLQVIGGDRTVPFETGGAGEVVAADLRWVRDDDGRYRLVLIRLD